MAKFDSARQLPLKVTLLIGGELTSKGFLGPRRYSIQRKKYTVCGLILEDFGTFLNFSSCI